MKLCQALSLKFFNSRYHYEIVEVHRINTRFTGSFVLKKQKKKEIYFINLVQY